MDDMMVAKFEAEFRGQSLVIELPREAWVAMENMARAALGNETGGLIYTQMLGEGHARVELVTPPPPDSDAGPHHIRMGDRIENIAPPAEIIAEEQLVFVGYWHSHVPAEGGDYTWSIADINALKALSEDLPGVWPIHIILGTCGDDLYSCMCCMYAEGEFVDFGVPVLPDTFVEAEVAG